MIRGVRGSGAGTATPTRGSTVRSTIVAAALSLCLVTSNYGVSAADPEPVALKIAGETKVPEYKLARLSVPAPAGAGVTWDVWPFEAADVDKVGGKIVFAAPPGEYTVVARVITFKDGAVIIDEAKVKIQFLGTPPKPPTPNPDKPIDGKLGLRKVSRENALPTTGWKELSDSIRSHASAVGAGSAGIKNGQFDPLTALQELGDKNTAAIGDEQAAKWDPWSQAVMKAFYEAYSAGKLKTRADWVDAFLEIADGLLDPKPQ